MDHSSDILKVILLEYDIVWENPEANFQIINDLIEPTEADIYFLPEMFSTGFTMNPKKIAEPFCGKSFNFLQQLAIEKDAAFTASIPTQVGTRYYNRLYWVEPNETFTIYDKRHLFTLVGEEKHYTAGKERKTIDYKGWKLMPQICYDLRFPVYTRNDLNYDIVFYLANWPQIRSLAWNSLRKARAIENMAYCIGVNRTGHDANNIAHSGDSGIYNAVGESLTSHSSNSNVLSFELSKNDLNRSREKFKFLNDRDKFQITY